MSKKIARRQFMKLSAGAAAGYLVHSGSEAQAQDLPHITEDDPLAVGLKYTHDASAVDPATRTQPAAEQSCMNCVQLQGTEGDEWRPCAIFAGKLVNANGWCSVWVPKS